MGTEFSFLFFWGGGGDGDEIINYPSMQVWLWIELGWGKFTWTCCFNVAFEPADFHLFTTAVARVLRWRT